MVTTNDSRIRDDIATLSYHGIKKIDYERHKPWFKEAKYYGFNYRLSNVLAAIGLVQLSKIKYLNDKRREYAAYFNMELRECDELDLPIENLLCYHVYQMYTIKIKSDRVKRDLFVKTMRDKGIECGIHFYPPLHEQKLYKNYLRLDDYLPITEKVSNRIVSLPLYPGLRKKDLDYIVLRIKETLCKLKK